MRRQDGRISVTAVAFTYLRAVTLVYSCRRMTPTLRFALPAIARSRILYDVKTIISLQIFPLLGHPLGRAMLLFGPRTCLLSYGSIIVIGSRAYRLFQGSVTVIGSRTCRFSHGFVTTSGSRTCRLSHGSVTSISSRTWLLLKVRYTFGYRKSQLSHGSFTDLSMW